MIRAVFLSFLCLAVWGVSAPAQSATPGAEKYVQGIADRGVAFWSDPSLSDSARKGKWRSLLKSSFDLESIGRFALGQYWRSASAAQQREYLKLFEGMVVNSYATRFGEYKGQKVTVKSSREINEKDTLVSSVITSTDGAPDAVVDWRVRKKGGAFKVIDVLVEGVSMSQTHRSEFTSVIQRGDGTISPLLAHLRQ